MKIVLLLVLSIATGGGMGADCGVYRGMVECCSEGYSDYCEWQAGAQGGACVSYDGHRAVCGCVFFSGSCEDCADVNDLCAWNGTLCMPVESWNNAGGVCPSYWEDQREGQVGLLMLAIGAPCLLLMNCGLFVFWFVWPARGDGAVRVRVVS